MLVVFSGTELAKCSLDGFLSLSDGQLLSIQDVITAYQFLVIFQVLWLPLQLNLTTFQPSWFWSTYPSLLLLTAVCWLCAAWFSLPSVPLPVPATLNPLLLFPLQ